MATSKRSSKQASKSSESQEQLLFPPSHSQGYQQAKTNWRQNWQAVFEQCSDFFVRY